MTIKEAFATHTGGGQYIFTGELNDGNYFLMDDYGSPIILDIDPGKIESAEEGFYLEDIMNHCIRILDENERLEFNDLVLDYLLNNLDHAGGLDDQRINWYRGWFALLQ